MTWQYRYRIIGGNFITDIKIVTATVQKKSHNMKYVLKATLFCIVFIALLAVLSFAKGFVPPKFERLSYGFIGTFVGFLTTLLFLKFDKKKFSDIGLMLQRTTLIKFFTGILAGVIIMGLMVTGVFYFSNASIEFNHQSNIWYFLLMTSPLIPLAFMEELGFRAYPLETLKDKIGIRLAIIVTAILFVLYHIANGWTIASSFYGTGVFGLVFGLGAIYSRGIAMSTGIHYAVNLTTSACGVTNSAQTIWVVKQSQNVTATIIAHIILLVFALICIELYLRQKTTANKVHNQWQE